MWKPDFITFTGADDETDVEQMVRLAGRYPIEWGILFSPSRQGRDPRYPKDAYWRFANRGLRLAAHLCGEWSRMIVERGEKPALDLSPFMRVQVNYAVPLEGHVARVACFQAETNVSCIMQWRGSHMFPYQRGAYDEVEWLYDPSGGHGTPPMRWPEHPGGARRVGYAGGISPVNVARVLAEVNADAKLDGAKRYWLDMESGVRTNERFDLAKVEAVCAAVYGARPWA